MSTEQALLGALHDDPGDDATWLVLADLLEEQGARAAAELMRLLRALRGMPEGERPQAEADGPGEAARGRAAERAEAASTASAWSWR